MNTIPFLIDAVGWTGAALVIIAYGLLSVQWMSGNSFSYQALNVAGALLLVINSYYLGAYPSVGVNAVWVGIAALTLFRDWWKGPTEAVKKAAFHFSKRHNLRKITLRHIKLPAFKQMNRNPDKRSSSSNRLGQPQTL
jgi:hypothetical protein